MIEGIQEKIGEIQEKAESLDERFGVRAAIDRASDSLRGLTRAGEEWAEERAIEIGKGLRDQGARAVDRLSRRVEQYPLASLGVAFALGVLCAALIRRSAQR